jgi:hypothetical protein
MGLTCAATENPLALFLIGVFRRDGGGVTFARGLTIDATIASRIPYGSRRDSLLFQLSSRDAGDTTDEDRQCR